MEIAEADRIAELNRYDVLDTAPEEAFDRLAELAAKLTHTPIALISLVDEHRLYFKAHHGLQMDEANRAGSFCTHAVGYDRLFVVEDAALDARFAGSPYVTGDPHVRFYAGAPIMTPNGYAIGCVCIIDRQPRSLTAVQREALQVIAKEVTRLLELRRELLDLRRSEALRQEAVEALMAMQGDLQHRIELRTRDLADAHQRTRQILERVADGFVALDRNWRYTYVNERAASMFGRKPEQLVGKHIWTEFPEGVGQPFQLAYERAMREQVTLKMEEYYQPWDRWYENRIYPSPDGLTIFFTDITERKIAYTHLAESQRRLLEAQRVAHVGSWEWDVATNRVTWSDEMFRIYGMPPTDSPGGYEEFLARVHPDDRDMTKEVIGGALADPQPFVYDHRIVRADGATRMLHTRGEVVADPAHQPMRMIGSCWDVTDQAEASAELKRTVALLEATLDATGDGLLAVDGRGRLTAWNRSFLSMFGIPAELAGKRDEESLLAFAVGLFTDGPAFLRMVRDIYAHPDVDVEDELHLKDGRVIKRRSIRQRIGDDIVGRLWIFRDVTPTE